MESFKSFAVALSVCPPLSANQRFHCTRRLIMSWYGDGPPLASSSASSPCGDPNPVHGLTSTTVAHAPIIIIIIAIVPFTITSHRVRDRLSLPLHHQRAPVIASQRI